MVREMERVLVTGGAGFIGSHLVDRLVGDYEVVVLDDLSGGSLDNLNTHKGSPNFRFTRGSVTDESDVFEAMQEATTVFHFAAQPDVRLSVSNPMKDFEVNVVGSLRVLEAMRRLDVPRILFASSGGTVYGETDVFPTPESTPFRPISNYGAAKGAVEMYLSSYASLYGIDAVSLRFGNVIGPRSTHGVIYDFYMKLRRDPSKLEVLGDGRQEKAYMYIDDAIDAVLLMAERMGKGYLPVNISSGERLTVRRIAEIVTQEVGASDARIVYTGTERGWAGDVVITDIDISLLKSFGWTRRTPIEDGVRKYVRWLVRTLGPV